MKRKLFKNYQYNFDKNEKKVLINFCKQATKQMVGNEQFRKDIISFNSIMDKLSTDQEEIKLTKDEKIRLVLQLKENSKFLKKKMDGSWFFVKWFYKSVYNQYASLLTNHFSE